MGIKELIARVRGESITVGVDIGHYSIKLAAVRHAGTKKILLNCGILPLPAGTILDNEIRNEDELKKSLSAHVQTVFPDSGKSDLVVGINWSNGVIADTLHLEVPPDQNEEEVILAQATSRSPFDEDGIVLDHHTLRRNEKFADVLVVAAKSAMLERWTRIFHEIQLKPIAMDVDSFAISNVYLDLYNDDTKENAPTVGVLIIGDRKSHISFIKGGAYHSTREIQNSAVNQIAHVACRHLGVNYEAANAFLRGERRDAYNEETLRAAVDYACEDLARGVEQAIQYYESSEKMESVSSLFVTGGGAAISGVLEALAAKLNRKVELLNPLEKLIIDERLFPGGKPSLAYGATLAVAVGLALRKF